MAELGSHPIEWQTPQAVRLGKGDLFVCRDAALANQQVTNLALWRRLEAV
jgi:hypothetical protein